MVLPRVTDGMYYRPHYALGLEHAKQGVSPKKAFDTQDAATIGIKSSVVKDASATCSARHDGKDGIDFAKKNNKQTSPATAAGPGNITQKQAKHGNEHCTGPKGDRT